MHHRFDMKKMQTSRDMKRIGDMNDEIFERLEKQNYKLRRRYFSPELRETLSSMQQKHKQKLRWVGSTAKLSASTGLSEEAEEKIGSYIFYREKEIGSGYSSKVYKARKIGDDQDYAIKVIELKKYTSSNLEMLANEIKILKTLDHPNVLRCYDIYRKTNRCYIVTEYCPFGDLHAHISKRGRLTEDNSLEIVSSVIEGCKYLMQKNILHRDLKPANILKSATGWKIADFGFSVESEGDLIAKYNVGTPLYMPPQALIENLYSTKSDIFAVGIILYELMIGCTPWQSRTERDLIKKISTNPFKIPEKHKLSGRVKNLLQKMCNTNHKQRMGKEEFMDLSLGNAPQEPNPEEKRFQGNITERFFQPVKNRFPHRSVEILPKVKNLILLNKSGGNEIKEEDQKRTMESQNNHILVNQLHYCRFLYYFVRNRKYIMVAESSSQKLTLVIFKHLLKLTKQLSDSSFNWFKLKDWNRFKYSKKYLNTHLTIKEYALRYEREYLAFLKTLEVNVIRETNKEFVQFSNLGFFNLQFYQKLLGFIDPLIRSFNHNIGVSLMDCQEWSCEQAGQMQALKSLYKYHNLIVLSMEKFEDNEYFEQKSGIKVHVDFKKVGNKLEEYHDLRQELKDI